MGKRLLLLCICFALFVSMVGINSLTVQAISIDVRMDEDARAVEIHAVTDAASTVELDDDSWHQYVLMQYDLKEKKWVVDEEKTTAGSESVRFTGLQNGIYALFKKTADDFMSDVLSKNGFVFSVDASGMRKIDETKLQNATGLAIGMVEINTVFLYLAAVEPTPTPTVPPAKLTVVIHGNGQINPNGISYHPLGETVVFSDPIPGEGYRFDRIQINDGRVIKEKLKLLMNQDKQVDVYFVVKSAPASPTPTITPIPTKSPEPEITGGTNGGTGGTVGGTGGTVGGTNGGTGGTVGGNPSHTPGDELELPPDRIPNGIPIVADKAIEKSKLPQDDIQLPQEELPKGNPFMPNTGGLPILLIFLLGTLLILDGILLNRRLNRNTNVKDSN